MPDSMDDLSWDVLKYLTLSPDLRMRRREIRNHLIQKYRYEKATFDVVLQRRLDKLIRLRYTRKQSKTHQHVYYYIPKNRQKVISDLLRRRLAHERVDEIWNNLTHEQQEKAVENLSRQQALLIQTEKYLVKNLLSFFKDMATLYISDIKKRPESSDHKFSPKQRQEFLRQLRSLRDESISMETNIETDKKFLKEKYEEILNLAMEFTEKVVEPYYNGRFNEAILDLMREAIEKHEKER